MRPIRRAGRGAYDVARGVTSTHARLRERIVAIVALTILLDLVFAAAILLFERHAARTEIHGYGSSLFWTTSQLLTVSSSMPNPLSTGGRILDVLMEAYAITIVATLAGSFGDFFRRRGEEAARHGDRPPAAR